MDPASQHHKDEVFDQLLHWAQGHDSIRAIPSAAVDEFSDYGERLGYEYPLELDERVTAFVRKMQQG